MGARFQNWSGSVGFEVEALERPRDEAALARLVAAAAAAGRSVRPVGSGHSGTPLVETPDVLVETDAIAGVESCDADARRAVVRAGTKLCDLGGPLLERGLAMENLGDIDRQSLAGAIGTGTHGTGRTLGNLSSQVEALRYVDAAGRVVEERDPVRLRGLRVSLGALGVFTAVGLRLVPAYRLHERIWREGVDECLDRLGERIAATRHFEFFWLPHRDVVECKSLAVTAEPPNELADRPYERIGWSADVIASEREQRFFEMEYAVPAERGPACFREVRERMRARHPQVIWPVEYRTVRADDAWLSPASGRETVTLSIHQGVDLPHRELFEDLEPIFWQHGGRPHWGKLHTLDAARLAPLYPDWDRFHALRDELDPKGVFLSPALRRLLAA